VINKIQQSTMILDGVEYSQFEISCGTPPCSARVEYVEWIGGYPHQRKETVYLERIDEEDKTLTFRASTIRARR
jgi:hypothetical protein